MSSNRTGKSTSAPPLARLVVAAAAVGAATWVAASMLATARAGQESEELARPIPEEVTGAAADEPAPPPASASTGPAEDSPQGVEPRMRPRRPAGVDASATDSGESEWRTAVEAMRTLAPNAVHRIERAPRNAPGRARMMRAMLDRYRELQRIQRRDPEQYKREVEQTELEDEILGAARRLARETDTADAYEMRVQIRDMIGKLVDLRIRNREARLQRLAATVEAERKRLEQEKGNRERMIDRQFGVVTRAHGGGHRPGGPREPSAPPLPPQPELAAPNGPTDGDGR